MITHYSRLYALYHGVFINRWLQIIKNKMSTLLNANVLQLNSLIILKKKIHFTKWQLLKFNIITNFLMSLIIFDIFTIQFYHYIEWLLRSYIFLCLITMGLIDFHKDKIYRPIYLLLRDILLLSWYVYHFSICI